MATFFNHYFIEKMVKICATGILWGLKFADKMILCV